MSMLYGYHGVVDFGHAHQLCHASRQLMY